MEVGGGNTLGGSAGCMGALGCEHEGIALCEGFEGLLRSCYHLDKGLFDTECK